MGNPIISSRNDGFRYKDAPVWVEGVFGGRVWPITVSKLGKRLFCRLPGLFTGAAIAEQVRGVGRECRSTVASSRPFVSGLTLALSRPRSPSPALGVGNDPAAGAAMAGAHV